MESKNVSAAVPIPARFIQVEAKISLTPETCMQDLVVALLNSEPLRKMLDYVVDTPHSKTIFNVIRDAGGREIGELTVSLDSETDG